MATDGILVGDVLTRLRRLPDNSVHCVVTSPPYWGLRDYGTGTWEGGAPDCKHVKGEMRRGVNLAMSAANTRGGAIKCAEVEDVMYGQTCGTCGANRVDNQIGLERTPAEYLAKMVLVFREVRRVLRSDGTCWVNMGDSYCSQPNQRVQHLGGRSDVAGYKQSTNNGSLTQGSSYVPGLKPKDLIGMPWRLAFALQDDGWWLRQDIIWSKPNPMPESVTDRCTKAHEYVFLLTKSARYFYDAEAIKEAVTGDAHERGNGVNPKARGGETGVGFGHGFDAVKKPRYKATGPNSRQKVDRDAAHLSSPRPKQNESFSGAVNELVSSRNKRSVWEIATEAYSEAHFATFPTKLVEPCILAGTSEAGVCAACGKPWVRTVVKSRTHESGCGRSGNRAEGKLAGGTQVRDDHDIRNGPVVTSRTTGWSAGCHCNAQVARPVVLDPFGGSMTTGLVAMANRCDFIGIELNPEYAEMGERRLLSGQPLLNTVEVIL